MKNHQANILLALPTVLESAILCAASLLAGLLQVQTLDLLHLFQSQAVRVDRLSLLAESNSDEFAGDLIVTFQKDFAFFIRD